MTIRYECECGSVLKIEERKAGTELKCPKCKKKFIVPDPQPESSGDQDSRELETSSEETMVSPPPKKPAPTPAPVARKEPAREPTREVAEKPAASPKTAPEKPAVEKPTAPVKEAAEKPAAVAEKAAAPPAKPSSNDDDFDPADFLMAGNNGPVRATAGLTAAPEEPKKGPSWSRGGRRPIAPVAEDPGAGSAGGGGAATASANARDLLTKSMEESKVRAASLPPDKPRQPLIDFSGFRQELKSMIPYAIGVLVAMGGLYYLVDSAMADRAWMPDLGRVRGRITVEGQPFANVRVTLNPVVAKTEINGKTQTIGSATALTDAEGNYEVQYTKGVWGAPVGKVRVSLEPEIATPENIRKIPASFAGNSGPQIEVKATGNDGAFDFDLRPSSR
jgi:hypothetical protein